MKRRPSLVGTVRNNRNELPREMLPDRQQEIYSRKFGFTAKDGTKWTVVTQTALTGRLQSQNVFTAKPGPTAYTRTVTRPVDAFRLLIDSDCCTYVEL